MKCESFCHDSPNMSNKKARLVLELSVLMLPLIRLQIPATGRVAAPDKPRRGAARIMLPHAVTWGNLHLLDKYIQKIRNIYTCTVRIRIQTIISMRVKKCVWPQHISKRIQEINIMRLSEESQGVIFNQGSAGLSRSTYNQ